MKCIIPEYISFINLKIDECQHCIENQTCVNMYIHPDEYRIVILRYPSPFSFTNAGIPIINVQQVDGQTKVLMERIHFMKKNEPLEQCTLDNFMYGDTADV